MKLVDASGLRVLLATVDAALEEPAEIVLVGGSALLVLVEGAEATHDMDAIPTDTTSRFEEAFRVSGAAADFDFNTRSAAFEAYLPESWLDRVRRSEGFSTPRIAVFTPSPEDLAVMKLFRFHAKDADDIARLARLPGFDPELLRRLFLEVLPVAIGDPRWHAGSFCLAWNSLYPDSEVEIEEILEEVGLAPKGIEE